jgi:hypothetical protein
MGGMTKNLWANRGNEKELPVWQLLDDQRPNPDNYSRGSAIVVCF